MSLSAKLAWRNIFRQKRRSILTVMTMTGGFVLSSLSIGWMNGSYSNMILFFTSHRTGQIQLHAENYLNDRSIYDSIENYGEVSLELSGVEDVEAWSPRIYAGALLASRSPGAPAGLFSNSAGASIIGIDPVMEENATSFSSQIISGTMLGASRADSVLYAAGEILLGKELAMVLNAEAGDSLVLFSQATDGSSADRRYAVKGIVSTGNSDLDRSTAYITLADAQLLFAMENRVHEIAVITGSLDKVDAAVEHINIALNDTTVAVESWQVFAKEFYNGMKADEASLKITLGIILAMAALGVLNTILMMVLERRREFGVMKAVGTPPGKIVRMILLEANFLAVLSVILGSLISFAGLAYLSRHGIVLDQPLDYGGFIFREMMAKTSLECFWIPTVSIMITASVVSLLPALRASRTDPAKSLRTV